MDWSIVATAFVFGLTASLSCLGLCIPILVPYIMERDKTLKEGLYTSIFFSFGRLIIYFAIGIAVFMIGSTVTEDVPESWLNVAVVILGCVVIAYGAWSFSGFQNPNGVPQNSLRTSDPCSR